MFRGNQMVKENTSLEEIQLNSIREQEVQKELEKKDKQVWKNNRVVYIEGRIYVLNNQKIQEQILQENHKLADVEYLGQKRILKLVKRNYWWPKYRTILL